MVPRQLTRVFEAAASRRREEMKLVLISSYQVALFSRAKKLPSLEALLNKFDRAAGRSRPDKRRMSWQEMQGVARQWTQYRAQIEAKKQRS